MQVLPEFNKPYILESLTSPIVIKHCWMFNAPACDFWLEPIKYLEETTGPVLKVRINNTEFWVPSDWNILVTDRDTCQLDTVPIQSCASVRHEAFAFVSDELKLRTLEVMVLDYNSEATSVVHPMINKGMALVHPVGPAYGGGRPVQLSVIIGPHDLHKHLNGKIVGDLFS
jgi:hypothetical protein